MDYIFIITSKARNLLCGFLALKFPPLAETLTQLPSARTLTKSPLCALFFIFLIEFINFRKRRKNEQIIFKKAVDRATEIQKDLYIVWDTDVTRLGTIYSLNSTFDISSDNSFPKMLLLNSEQLNNIVDLQENVLLNLYGFETNLPNIISDIPFENIFSINHQPWSITAYINRNGFPQNIVLFSPPYHRYITIFRNPIRSKLFILLLLFTLFTFYFK